MDKINIDFEVINTNNPKTLLIGDTSRWLYASKEPAFINITLPGYSKPKVFSFSKDSLKVYNSNNLGITELVECDEQRYTDLPDGVYTIVLESGYENINKKRYYLKTDRLRVEIAKAVASRIIDYSKYDKEFMDKVMDIESKVYVANSFTIVSNIVEATKFYNEAVEDFNNLKEC